MARRNDHTRDELKALIIKSAAEIIEQDGFQALTARKIANAIGYTPGTLYNVFESMDALSLVLNAVTLEKLLTALSQPECNDSRKTPLQNIKRMAEIYKSFALENKQRWVMLFGYILPEGVEIPEWFREKISLLFQPLEKLLQPYFKDAHSKEHKIAARNLWAAIHGICFLQLTGKLPLLDGEDVSTSMTDSLIENFVKGLE